MESLTLKSCSESSSPEFSELKSPELESQLLTGKYVECWLMCGAATMFSRPFVSTVVRQRNFRLTKSNAPTSAVFEASSRLCRPPNSAKPKYATFSITARPFMNVLLSSCHNVSNVPL